MKIMHQATEYELCCALSFFVDECITPEKKDRYQYLLKSLKGRKKWLNKLDHFQCELNITSALNLDQKLSSQKIIDTLRIPSSCQSLIFSTIKGSEFGLIGEFGSLVEHAWGFGCGAIICTLDQCRSANLYFGEEEQAQFCWFNKRKSSREPRGQIPS